MSEKCIKCRKKHCCFNTQGETKALYCGDCREPHMIDVKNPKCIRCQKKSPSFNIKGETKALFCADCRLPHQASTIETVCIDEANMNTLRNRFHARYNAVEDKTTERNQLKYVAITRASKQLYFIH